MVRKPKSPPRLRPDSPCESESRCRVRLVSQKCSNAACGFEYSAYFQASVPPSSSSVMFWFMSHSEDFSRSLTAGVFLMKTGEPAGK